MKKIKLSNSRIVEIGQGEPIVGVVGFLHGDEICGRRILDELLGQNGLQGTLRLIYANLAAEKAGQRGVEGNLNRTFYKEGLRVDGDLEERTAAEIAPHLNGCQYVIDIHSTSYPTDPFAISIVDTPGFEALASFTGLSKYVVMAGKLAKGGSLIDEVYRRGGMGISFESGTHYGERTVDTARRTVNNLLRHFGVIEGEGVVSQPEKFKGVDIREVPKDAEGFVASKHIRNFEQLKAGTPYGSANGEEYTLDYDCWPFLFSDKLVDGKVFFVGQKC